MPSSRSCNKFCLSLDSSSSDTSSSTVRLHRWSEVVPPKTALTFAALWDPEEGMVTFSGAALFESESLSSLASHPDLFDDDGHSQFILNQDSGKETTTSEDGATLTTFQDAFKAFLHRTPWSSREHLQTKAGRGTPCCLQTRASSTFDGLDVYSHDLQIKPKRSLQHTRVDLLDTESSFRTPSAFGRLRLRSDLMLDLYRPESKESDSSTASRHSNLRSRFSTTTTSTSNYIDVAAGAVQSTRLSETSHTPEWPKDECLSPASSWSPLPHRRRLRKRRPTVSRPSESNSAPPSPTTPRKIKAKSMSPLLSPRSTTTAASDMRGELARGRFPRPIGALIIPAIPTTPPASPITPKSPSTRRKLRFTLLRKKPRQSSPEFQGWVLVEVTPVIRQRIMADLDED